MDQKAVYTHAKWQVKDGQLETVLGILKEVAKKSSEEEGNLVYKVHQSNSDAHVLILFEGYEDDAAVEAHRNSEHFQQLVIGRIVPLLEQREVILMRQII
jgi:quinol monooxygenase YgiN